MISGLEGHGTPRTQTDGKYYVMSRIHGPLPAHIVDSSVGHQRTDKTTSKNILFWSRRNKWMFLGHSNLVLWVPPLHKEAFFDFLEEFQTAQPDRVPLQASTGQALVTTSVFIYRLLSSGCRTLRLKGHDQKITLDSRRMVTEPAEAKS